MSETQTPAPARVQISTEIVEASAKRPNLWAALALAQSEIRNVTKNRTVKVTMKSGGQYSYAYATLDEVLEAIRKPLAKNGLSVAQVVVPSPKGNWFLRTIVGHASGEELVSEMPVFVEAEGTLRAMQAFGSAITFARRYSLQNLFMLAADEDDDANAGSAEVQPKSKFMREPRRPNPAPQAPAPQSASQAPAAKPSPPPAIKPQSEAPKRQSEAPKRQSEPAQAPPEIEDVPWPDEAPSLGKHLGDEVVKFGSPKVKGKKLRDLPADVIASEWEFWSKNAKNDATKTWAKTLEAYMNSL